MIPIETPLPLVAEGDVPWCLSAEMLNLLARKVNAIYGMRAIAPILITKNDAGFVFHTGKTGLLPDDGTMPANVTPVWEATSVCIGGVPTTVYVFAGRVPA